MRSVGVEEELLLVNPVNGCPVPVASLVLDHAGERATHSPGGPAAGGLDPAGIRQFEAELQQQQVEARTQPHVELDALADDVRSARDRLIAAARAVGARLVAVGTSPLPVMPQLMPKPRYEEMAARFGLTADEHLTCGCHVHVSVDSDAEAVGVLDRIRVWLPTLLAISANSPFWQGADSGYASYRSLVVRRWPSAGPTEVFGSAANYRRLVSDMISGGVLLDEGMVYFDARVSCRYPTVEIRIADVCLDARDTVVVAALCRGLVETAARDWAASRPPPVLATPLLRLATWQAGRYGLAGNLLDPHTAQPRPAPQVVGQLLDHVGPALCLTGDGGVVEEGLARLTTHGNGADQQRAALRKTGDIVEVMETLANVTAGQVGLPTPPA